MEQFQQCRLVRLYLHFTATKDFLQYKEDFDSSLPKIFHSEIILRIECTQNDEGNCLLSLDIYSDLL